MNRITVTAPKSYTEFSSTTSSGLFLFVDQATGDLYYGDRPVFPGNYFIRKFSDSGVEDLAYLANQGTGFDQICRPSFGLQSTGKMVVTGSFTSFNGNTRNYCVRLNADGTEDTAFYSNLGTGFGLGTVFSIIQPDDKILIGGFFNTLNGSSTPGRFMRLNSDGTVDTAFSTNIGTGTGSDSPASAALLSTGTILVGCGVNFNGSAVNRLAALNSDGTSNATYQANIGSGFNTGNISGIGVMSDDSVVVTGTSYTTFNGNSRVRNVKLNADGTENGTFYTNAGAFAGSTNIRVSIGPSDDVIISSDSDGTKAFNSSGVLQYTATSSGIPITYYTAIYNSSYKIYWGGFPFVVTTTGPSAPVVSWTAPAGVTEIMITPAISTSVSVGRSPTTTVSVVPNTTYNVTLNNGSFALNTSNTFGAIYTWTGAPSIEIRWIE